MKTKLEENGKIPLKARLCPHVNRDNMKQEVRKDSATAQFDAICLMIGLKTMLVLRLVCIYIKGAYLQNGSLKRFIYVNTPK